MHLAYVDESGDPGAAGTHTYSLACILVTESSWLPSLDALLAFRRFVKTRFGIPVTQEFKASYLIGNRGPWLSKNPLPEGMRHAVYRQAMRLQSKLDFQTFAIVIDKPRLAKRDPSLAPAPGPAALLWTGPRRSGATSLTCSTRPRPSSRSTCPPRAACRPRGCNACPASWSRTTHFVRC